MNRKTFLRNLGLLALAPLAIRQIAKEESQGTWVDTEMISNNMSVEEVLYYWREYKILPYRTRLINWKISDMNNFYDKDENLI